jgi:ABC-type bacteriocin/lantibiotic exporter with double-glycine peptidase domain
MGANMVTSIVVLIVLVVIGVMLVGLFQMNQMKIIERIQQNFFTKTAFEFTEIIPRVDLKQLDDSYLPEKVNRFFDTVTVQKSISKILLDIPTASIQILFGIILLSLYNNTFIIFGLVLVTILWVILRMSSTQGIQTSSLESKYKYKVVEWMEEMARVVDAFKFSQGSNFNLKKTNENVVNYLKARTSHFKILLFQYRTLVAFKVLITAAMLGIGAVLLIEQKLNVGEFIAAEIIIMMVINSIEKLIGSIDSIYDVITSLEKIGMVTESKTEKEGTLELDNLGKGIEVNVSNLSFYYNDNAQALINVNFHLPINSVTCLSGPEGSGKSSVMKLLCGNYTSFDGNILLNHIPIGNYTLHSIRKQVGVFSNSQEIFHGTIWENITLGRTNISATEVTELALKLGIEDFLKKLPLGYETLIDPMGRRLSSTMTKNILMLRALAGNPSLLLLDEPWIGYEDAIQKKIQHSLLHDFKNTTILIATNHPDFANQCLQNIYMESGITKSSK